MSGSCIISSFSLIFLVASICCELISFLTTHMIDSVDLNTNNINNNIGYMSNRQHQQQQQQQQQQYPLNQRRQHQGIFRSCDSNYYINCAWFDFTNYNQLFNSDESK